MGSEPLDERFLLDPPPAALAAMRRAAGWPSLASGIAGVHVPGEAEARSRAIGRVARGFTAGLIARVCVLGLALAGLAWTAATPGLLAARVLAAILCGAALWAVWAHVRRTNLELARFVDAVGAGDLSQGFGGGARDGGFAELGGVLDRAMRRLRDERGRLSEEARFSVALVDETPTALLTVTSTGRVHLVNKAARRLFGDRDGLPRDSYAACGSAFVDTLDPAREPARRLIVPLTLGGLPQRAMLSIAGLSRLGAGLRLVAVEPIQRELAAAEIAAQADLVRVLTHEIMNSLTPVTSLARTAATLMERVDDAAGRDVADARAAVATLARRADALTRFVESYRQFARVPEIARRPFAAAPWGAELGRLLAAAAHGSDVAFSLSLADPGLILDADPDLLAQALINLMKNAAESAREASSAPAVRLWLSRSEDGGTEIAVEDNGSGLPPGMEADIFLPFFTTKAEGSGVGLSVARQIVVAHGGTIRAENRPGGGARFRIAL